MRRKRRGEMPTLTRLHELLVLRVPVALSNYKCSVYLSVLLGPRQGDLLQGVGCNDCVRSPVTQAPLNTLTFTEVDQ